MSGERPLVERLLSPSGGYVDMHCHILPGLDDGCRNLVESIEVARLAVRHGVEVMVASPHTLNGRYTTSRKQVLEATRSLQDELDQRGIPLRLVPGSELHFCADPWEQVRAGQAMTVGDSEYLIFELPAIELPQLTPALVLQMVKHGLVPLINHPERNAAIQQKPRLFRDLVRIGARGILCAGSLLGHFGAHARRCAESLLEQDCYHALASDAHGEARRPYRYAQAVERLNQQVTPPAARSETNPLESIAIQVDNQIV